MVPVSLDTFAMALSLEANPFDLDLPVHLLRQV